jgi:hypothetical protein
MYLQVVLRVRAYLISFHATTLHNPMARLQGGGFPPSPMGTLIIVSLCLGALVVKGAKQVHSDWSNLWL